MARLKLSIYQLLSLKFKVKCLSDCCYSSDYRYSEEKTYKIYATKEGKPILYDNNGDKWTAKNLHKFSIEDEAIYFMVNDTDIIGKTRDKASEWCSMSRKCGHYQEVGNCDGCNTYRKYQEGRKMSNLVRRLNGLKEGEEVTQVISESKTVKVDMATVLMESETLRKFNFGNDRLLTGLACEQDSESGSKIILKFEDGEVTRG